MTAASTMTEAQIEEFLQAPRHAIAGTNRASGPPQLSPVWYLYQEGRIYITVLAATAKYRNLQRDPRIAVCVDGGHPDTRAVTIYGTAELIEEDGPRCDEIHRRIVRRYFDSDEQARRWSEEARHWGRRALIVVTPRKTISQDYN